MTNQEFVKVLARTSGCTQTQVRAVMSGLADALVEVVAAQDDIVLGKAIRLSGIFVDEHSARNPLTGEAVTVPGKVKAKAKIMPGFKLAVAEGIDIPDDAE